MLRFIGGPVVLLVAGLIVGCQDPGIQGGSGIASAGGAPVVAQPSATIAEVSTAAPAFTPTPTNTPTAETKSAPSTVLATATKATNAPVASPTTMPAETPVAAPSSTVVPGSQNNSGADEMVSRGLEVYRTQYCGICHQLSAAETAGNFGPAHDAMGSVAEQRIDAPGYRGAATTPGEYILESVIDPKAYVVPGYEITSHHMPAYAHLEQADLEALVQLLLSQR